MWSKCRTSRTGTGSRLAESLVLAALVAGCATFRPSREVAIPTVNNNVCKTLKGRVIYYAVFVDSKYSQPWSTYDILSTMDSIRCAMDWVEQQAADRGVELKIDVVSHTHGDIRPVRADLPRKTLAATVFAPNGERSLDRWADKAGKAVAMTLGPDTARIILTKNNPSNTERLIARVRDIHKLDNVALFYMVNNYYREDISVVLHSGSFEQVEYGVQSFKSPAVIAHEFLHLFGALDLYVTPFDNKRAARKRKEFAMREFPNEIMAFTHRSLDSLQISPLTEYLVGWSPSLDDRYVRMITNKRIRVARY
ncbi:MAG TPA: hypothetical protein PKD45_12940 [Flavobacteriales bacterium]|nr:hypothetical protein [Flavobacteriales bacterium]